jgi:hypothetical protein
LNLCLCRAGGIAALDVSRAYAINILLEPVLVITFESMDN